MKSSASLFAFLIPLAAAAGAQEPTLPAPDVPPGDGTETEFVDMSLEALMSLDIEVTSASKQAQSLGSAAAAIFVVTNEDIRRSGARSIPEALRMVPGLHVARINGSTWAVASRGFTNRFGNKILVLIDGRSVYSPTFSGVYWDVQDVLLEDVDRIEIIRGPGAALWGANAANGVINIITRTAEKTQGAFVEVGGGTEEKGFLSARYGGALGEKGHFRVYAKTFDRDGRELEEGDTIEDDWHQGRAGFRADWAEGEKDTLTLQGDVYRGHADAPLTMALFAPPFAAELNAGTDVNGGNLLSRWTHTISENADFSLQAYYDVTNRNDQTVDSLDTFDVEYQHHVRLSDRHDLIFGCGYRRNASYFQQSSTIAIFPETDTDQIFSAFLQDDIGLVPEKLALILGAKYEHNDYTGSEVQPNVRIVWTPDEDHTVWGGVSRAVRTPSRVESDSAIAFQVFPDPGGFLDIVTLFGNENLKAEELIAYELGTRVQAHQRVSFDLALFYNVYDSLSSIEPGAPFFDGTNVIIPLTFDDKLNGTTWGTELAVEWEVTNDWRLRAAYTLLLMDLYADGDSTDTTAGSDERNDPQNQLNVRSLLDLTETVQLDLSMYYVDSAPGQDISSYFRGDARLGWRPKPWIDISLAAQGFFHDGEPEPGNDVFRGSTNADTAFYLSASWRF